MPARLLRLGCASRSKTSRLLRQRILKVHHHCPLVHRLREPPQLRVRRAPVVVVLHVFQRVKDGDGRERVALAARVRLGGAGPDRADVRLAVLKKRQRSERSDDRRRSGQPKSDKEGRQNKV